MLALCQEPKLTIYGTSYNQNKAEHMSGYTGPY
jgi:hypothetical protein